MRELIIKSLDMIVWIVAGLIALGGVIVGRNTPTTSAPVQVLCRISGSCRYLTQKKSGS